MDVSSSARTPRAGRNPPRTLRRARLRGRRIREGACACLGRVAPEGPGAHAGRGSRGPTPIVVGTLWSWWKWSGCPEARGGASHGCSVAVVARSRGGRRRSGPRPPVAGLRAALRVGAHVSLPQAEYGMDHPSGAPSRAGRPLEVVGGCRLHAGAWDASETTETVREISRAAQRTPFGAGQALPGPQKGHLRPGRERKRTFRDGRKAHRKTPRA
jgi:hypothetical protein